MVKMIIVKLKKAMCMNISVKKIKIEMKQT